MTSTQIESALVISPRSEQQFFKERDRFDTIVVMDRSSTALTTAPPLTALNRAIYELEFKKNLKKPPILLVGGMAAWKRDLGEEMITSLRSPAVPPSRPAEKPQYRPNEELVLRGLSNERR